MSDLVGFEDVLRDPHGVARRLLEDQEIFGLTQAEVRRAKPNIVVFLLTLEPWAATAAHGYPTEQVTVTVHSDRRIQAVPVNSQRRWLHRNPDLLGSLCLWFPDDPRALRWDWPDGLAAYVAIVHRHLQAEECWRRHNVWPGEDAPHGPGPHPIRTLDLWWASR